MLYKMHQNDEKQRKLMENNSKGHRTQCDVATDTFRTLISGFIFHDISHSDSVPESHENSLKNTSRHMLLMVH